MLDVEALKAPIAGESPVGPDLRGEVDFNEVEEAPLAFSGMAVGDYRKTLAKCAALFARTKDQIPAIVALEAAARLADLAEMRAALALVEHLIADHWDDYHPGPADEMGDARINELAALKRRAALLLPLSRMPLAKMPGPGDLTFTAPMLIIASSPVPAWGDEDESRLGAMVEKGNATKLEADAQRLQRERGRMLRQICRLASASARAADSEAEISYEMPEGSDIEGLARGLIAQVEAMQAPLADFSNALYGIDEIFDSKLGSSPGLAMIGAEVSAMARACAEFVAAFTDPVAEAAAESAAEAVGESPGGGAVAGGVPRAAMAFGVDSVRSRADVYTALDAIVRYYTDSEPGSPVPLMLRRVRAWVDKDFLEIMRDISPSQSDELERLLVSPPS